MAKNVKKYRKSRLSDVSVGRRYRTPNTDTEDFIVDAIWVMIGMGLFMKATENMSSKSEFSNAIKYTESKK